MSKMQGVDYAWERPNLDVLWDNGIRFVCRYLAADTSSSHGKILFKNELDLLHRKGFGVVLNWEQGAGDMLSGYTLGFNSASKALRQALLLGAPDNVPIYFSCDFDTTNAAQLQQVERYLQGCRDVLGYARVGVYGEYEVIQKMVPRVVKYGWQTYAWSHGLVSSNAGFWQYRNNVPFAGVRLDLDEVLNPAAFGAWFPEGSDMLTPEDLSAIAHAVWTHPLGQGTPGFGGQQAETAEAFAWEAAQHASTASQAAVEAIAALSVKLDNLATGDGLSETDIQSITDLTDAVNSLNNRLASP